jgi:hypothetical protein
MTVLFVLLGFITGYIACYFMMTNGVDQEGFWVSTKEFERE